MRVNIYREELPRTPEVEIVTTEPRPGVVYHGVRIILASAKELHQREGDDDRSAVTFWVGSLDEASYFAEAVKAKVDAARGVTA